MCLCAQKNEPTRLHSLEQYGVKSYLDQVTKGGDFDARNYRTASGAPIRRKRRRQKQNASTVDKETSSVVGKKRKCSKKSHAVSRMTWVRKAREKANVIDQVLLLQKHRSPNENSKDGKRAAKRKVPKGPIPSGKTNQPSCFRYLTRKCKKPFCDRWHPPECVKLNKNGGCKCCENVRFCMQITMKHQAKSRKTRND